MADVMTVGSLFSGIGGLDLGLERAGMRVIWQCEKDPACRRVLAHHWPDVPCHEDVTTVDRPSAVDVLTGGFPCQDVSVAGRRAGLAGGRSGLFHQFVRVAGQIAPRWLLIENVPGLLSSNGGRDMGTVIGNLVDLRYSVAWRVLDAQYFGVAQRRRRVFIVASLGGRADRAAQVLFEPESCDRGTPPGRDTRPDTTVGTLGGTSPSGGWGVGADEAAAGQAVPELAYALTVAAEHRGIGQDHNTTYIPTLARSLTASERWDGDTETFLPVIGFSHQAGGDHTASGAFTDNLSPTLQKSQTMAVAYNPYRTLNPDGTITSGYAPRPVTDALHSPTGNKEPLFVSPVGYNDSHADATQARSREVLRSLRNTVGEEAYVEWATGVLAALRTPEVLQSDVHGPRIHGATVDEDSKLVNGTPPGAGALPAWSMFVLQDTERSGRASQGPRPSQQLARELSTYLSVLSQPGASCRAALLGMWEASEGLGIVRQALSAIQDLGRSAYDEAESTQPTFAVRRLTPLEAERLQGFPDGWTDVDGAKDSSRYRQLGNAVAVPCAAWIGRRLLEQIKKAA